MYKPVVPRELPHVDEEVEVKIDNIGCVPGVYVGFNGYRELPIFKVGEKYYYANTFKRKGTQQEQEA